MGVFRSFGGPTQRYRQAWDYSSTPYLDILVRIIMAITIFTGIWGLLAVVFAPEPGVYLRFLAAMVAINLVLVGFRAWMRRR